MLTGRFSLCGLSGPLSPGIFCHSPDRLLSLRHTVATCWGKQNKKKQETEKQKKSVGTQSRSDSEQILHLKVPAKPLAQFDFVSPSQTYDFMHPGTLESLENPRKNIPFLPSSAVAAEVTSSKQAKEKESSSPLTSDLKLSGETSGLKSKFSLFTCDTDSEANVFHSRGFSSNTVNNLSS